MVDAATRDNDADFPESRLMTGEAVALDLMPTPWVLRAAGTAIDFIIYMSLYVVLLLFVLAPLADSGVVEDAVGAALAVSFAVVSLLVAPVAVETLTRGRSVGKLVIGSRIVRDDGGAIGFRHALIRALLGLLEFVITLGGAAAIVGFLNERSKRLGDYLAGTYSQRERVARRPTVYATVPPMLLHWASIADVARMPERLSRRLSQFLAQANGLTPTSRRRLAHDLAAEAAPFVSPLPNVEAETFITAIVAVRRDREFRAVQLQSARLDRLTPALTGLPSGFPVRD